TTRPSSTPLLTASHPTSGPKTPPHGESHDRLGNVAADVDVHVRYAPHSDCRVTWSTTAARLTPPTKTQLIAAGAKGDMKSMSFTHVSAKDSSLITEDGDNSSELCLPKSWTAGEHDCPNNCACRIARFPRSSCALVGAV